MQRTINALCVLALALSTPAASLAKDKQGKAKDPSHGINFYSIEREMALGKQMAEEVEREAKLVDDPVISEYVNRIGQNLVRNSDAKVPFTIKVIDSKEVNAFALPGGFFFVNSGLILKADNEAELAGVMAHEIAHVAARHATKQATRGDIINYASIGLIFIGGWAGYAVQQAAALAVPVGMMKFSRGMESEADHLGLEYVDRAGYDPLALVDFFEKLQSTEKKQPGTIGRLFSSHPMTGSRINAAQKEIQSDLTAKPQYVLDTSEFHQVKARLEAIEGHHKLDQDQTRPTLRRRSTGDVKTEPGDEKGKDEDPDRPTLKRR